ncbi:hypothetical protein B0T44_06200 [Nocardia donostiensis]|uniref:Uncharacterized protein n=1 Tax=Nocardia donostiensis TaxID=1538463 RepID=A0A1W0AR28_9NOCA|nr:hypothetical protein B0T46_05335 [Nocardia donostiensis]OQS12687.1 hypothetical protein B0T36_23665 [Nocardia donostiensis]OQS22224.1 hypothetical protein B0T44_06200 [Nocardia donostiensis]
MAHGRGGAQDEPRQYHRRDENGRPEFGPGEYGPVRRADEFDTQNLRARFSSRVLLRYSNEVAPRCEISGPPQTPERIYPSEHGSVPS